MSDFDFPSNMLLFGCGNMGSAMLRGWMAAGVDPARITVLDPFATKLPDGVKHYTKAADVPERFSHAVLAVKPQMLVDLAADFCTLLAPDAIVLSLLAGARTERLAHYLPHTKPVRLMPNLAVAIGKSPLGLFGLGLSEDDRTVIDRWLSPLGSSVWLAQENQMDAFTALAGSGPAFVYRFIDALGLGGADLGLDSVQSMQLALAMVEGAALLAAQSSDTPAELAIKVASPGGTTAAGLAVLDADDAIKRLAADTLRAARDRGVEMANGG